MFDDFISFIKHLSEVGEVRRIEGADWNLDPDEGWVNCGTYRIMIHDEKTLAFHSSPGKRANIMRQEYWAKLSLHMRT
jgi:UbiD family decarboxylase